MICYTLRLHIWFEAIISASFVAAFFRVMWFELFPSLAQVFAFGSFLFLLRFLALAWFLWNCTNLYSYTSLLFWLFWPSKNDCEFVKSAFWRCSLYFVGVFSTSALCVVPSIIRAYFVAVFQTARHIINVGARPHSQLQSAVLPLQPASQITQKHKMKRKYRWYETQTAVFHTRKLIKTPPESHAASWTFAVVTTTSRGMGAGTRVHQWWYTIGTEVH